MHKFCKAKHDGGRAAEVGVPSAFLKYLIFFVNILIFFHKILNVGLSLLVYCLLILIKNIVYLRSYDNNSRLCTNSYVASSIVFKVKQQLHDGV